MHSIVTSSARRRVQCLRSPIHFFRLASTSTNPYPYPSHCNPTPHQIFHLPYNASKADVKARYYDLVRIYHPDSIVNRAVAPETAQARFQSISAAYDVLRGKRRMAGSLAEDPEDTATTGAVHDYHELSTAMWRVKQRRRAELNFGIDERWKERLFLGAVLLTIGAFVAQTYSTRRLALSSALENPRDDPFVQRTRRKSLDDSALADDPPPTKDA